MTKEAPKQNRKGRKDMKKRIVAVLLAALMVTGLMAGCGNSGGDAADNAGTSDAPAQTESDAPAESDDAAAPEADAGSDSADAAAAGRAARKQEAGRKKAKKALDKEEKVC